VFGIAGRPMRSRRGPERRLVQPGQLVAWDPSRAHAGAAVDGQPWTSRLMIIEIAGLAALACDQENDVLADVAFAEPVLSDPDISRDFVRMHIALEGSSTRLERDERPRGMAVHPRRALLDEAPAARRRTQRDDRALRLACDYLGDRSERNVGLDELAAAGIGKFRLIRLFRDWTGLPPHALQVAHRIRVARRMLEANQTIAETAAATGFADQSHRHRHFVDGLGMTPGEYQWRFET
jgi:AraC-like DNA-binding protein